MSIWLVGAGPMAGFHADVLADFNRPVTIIATSPLRAVPLAEKHGMQAFTEGLEAALTNLPVPEAAIVSLPVDLLAQGAMLLAKAKVKRILLEKPGGLSADELEDLQHVARSNGCEIFVAYNRRFFSSVIEARRRIDAADEILSCSFEFCENADQIAGLPTAAAIKDYWLIANSSHVIDLAFHLCGQPTDWQHQTSGSLDWHPSAADFRGMGQTDRGASFSYFADWRGPGRWGMEIVLPQERLILRPMEALSVMPRGSFRATDVEIDNALDVKFKPGLYAQTKAFLADIVPAELVTLEQQIASLRTVYSPMANYES